MKRKSKFFKFLRKIVLFFYGKRKFIGLENIPNEPSIIVGNHSQAHGPLVAELLFPYPKYTWCIGQMMNRKEIPEYAMQDFWPYKKKSVRWFYKIIAHIIARPFAYVFSNADCIGVYKDARLMNTFKQSIAGLKDGRHIIIYPECHTPYNEIVYEFQDNFIDLARFYYKSTGKELSFVPMYIAPKLKTVVLGNPIKYRAEIPVAEQKNVICEYLKGEITSLAKGLPMHTVVPYANIPKKQYPKSK